MQNMLGTWVFLVLGGHALAVLILLAWSPRKQAAKKAKPRVSQKHQQQQQNHMSEIALAQVFPDIPAPATPSRSSGLLHQEHTAVTNETQVGRTPPDTDESSSPDRLLPPINPADSRAASASAAPVFSSPFAAQAATAFGSYQATSPSGARINSQMCLASPTQMAHRSSSIRSHASGWPPMNDCIQACHSPDAPFQGPHAQGRRDSSRQHSTGHPSPKSAAFLRSINPTFGMADSKDTLPQEQPPSGTRGPLSHSRHSQQQPTLNEQHADNAGQNQLSQQSYATAEAQDQAAPIGSKENLHSPNGLRMRGHRTQPAPKGILRCQEGTPSKDKMAKAKSNDASIKLMRLSTIPSLDAVPTMRPALHRRGRSMSRAVSCNDAGLPPLPSGLLPEYESSPAKASPSRTALVGDARRNAEVLTPWQKVMAVDWHPIRLIGCDCRVPIPRFSDVWLLFACMVWPPSAYTSDATTKSGEALPTFTCSITHTLSPLSPPALNTSDTAEGASAACNFHAGC